jgi:hypothetical protein
LGRIFERKSKPERAGTLSRMTLGASDDLKRLPPPSPILRVLTLTTSAGHCHINRFYCSLLAPRLDLDSINSMA